MGGDITSAQFGHSSAVANVHYGRHDVKVQSKLSDGFNDGEVP